MSLLVDLQLVPQRILEKVRAAVLQNREALRHGGIRSRVNQATKQRPQFTKVGATMRDYRAPVPVATGGQTFEPPNLGWVFNPDRIEGEESLLISGDGSASLAISGPSGYGDTVSWGINPYQPMRPFVAEYLDSEWSDWVWKGGDLFAKTKRLSKVRFPCRAKGAGGNAANIVLPAQKASVYVDYRASIYTYNYWVITAESKNIGSTASYPDEERLVVIGKWMHAPGLITSLPLPESSEYAAAYAAAQAERVAAFHGATKWMVLSIDPLPTLEDQSHQFYERSSYAMRTCSIRENSVVELDTPQELEQQIQNAFGRPWQAQIHQYSSDSHPEIKRLTTLRLEKIQYRYSSVDGSILLPTPRASLDPNIPEAQQEWLPDYLGVLSEDGYDFPVYTDGWYDYQGAVVGNSYEYKLHVPAYAPVEPESLATDADVYGFVQQYCSFGFIDKQQDAAYSSFDAYHATPAIYGVLDGTANLADFDRYNYNVTISELVSRFAFWPPKFQYLTYRDEVEDFYIDYEWDEPYQVIGTYAYDPANYEDPPYFWNFGGGSMETPGRPRSYKLLMAPKPGTPGVGPDQPTRVELPSYPQMILTTTYEANAYCTERLVELGFDVSDF